MDDGVASQEKKVKKEKKEKKKNKKEKDKKEKKKKKNKKDKEKEKKDKKDETRVDLDKDYDCLRLLVFACVVMCGIYNINMSGLETCEALCE